MYTLQRVKNPNECPQIQAFTADLPHNPYCADDKGYCYIRTRSHATMRAYIQPNTPFKVKWLIFDIDDPNALFAYHDNNAPRPQLIIKNPANGHAHYCYKLTFPIALWGNTNEKAIKYLDAVYYALKCKLGADNGYSGNLVKNPSHARWQTYTTTSKNSYTLDELAEYLDLEPSENKPRTQSSNDEHFGRNCAVFHATRHKAYPIAHKHDYRSLFNAVLAIATQENAKFDKPLPPNEIRHIAKSITRFCKSERFGQYSARFIEKQKREGRNGAIKANAQSQACSKGGKARSATYDPIREQAKQLKQQGLSIRKIAEQLKVSKTSVQNWLKI